MAQMLISSALNALMFSGNGFLFSKLNHTGYEAEMERHNKALELLAKSKEDFYEQQVKCKNRIGELRLEIANARTSEQQTQTCQLSQETPCF